MGIITILWEKWREFVRDFSRITLAAMVAPLMYLIVFGWGIRTTMNGQPYLYFLIPGVVSLTTMNGSFNAIAQNLNVQRLYEKAFDQVIISPTPLWQFIAGQIIAGALRGLYAGGIILLLVFPIKTGLVFNFLSFIISNYFIMPMAYLCNTFFSTDNIPHGARELIAILPLSQTSRMIRGIASGVQTSLAGILLLLLYLTVCTGIALIFVYQKKNL